MSVPAAASAPPATSVGAYRYVVVALLALAYMLSYADRQIVAVLVEPLKADLRLTDTQIGLLSGVAFTIFYTTFGIPLAWLADRTNRVRIVSAACLVWSLCSAASGFAANFWQLALARVGVGVGEAGGSPPSYSIMSDYFPPSRRGTAFSLYTLGAPCGLAVTSALGGFVAANHGWREAFYAVSLPGVFVAALILLCVREPIRGRLDGHAAPKPPGAAAFLRRYFGSAMLIGTSSAASLSALIATAVPAWAPAFLMRSKGMSMHEIALYYSVTIGTATAVGTFGSGRLLDFIGSRTPRAHCLLSAAAAALSLPAFLGYLYAADWRTGLIFLWISSALNLVYFTPVLVAVQNAVTSSERAMAGAVHMFVINAVGQALGPLLVGLISDRARTFGVQDPLQTGLDALVVIFILAIVAHVTVGTAIRRNALASRPVLDGGSH